MSNTKPTYEELENRLALMEKQYAACRQRNEALARERDEFLSIFDSLDAGIYISDPHTFELLYANEVIKGIVRKGANVLGEKCYRVFQNLDRPCEFCTNSIIFTKNPGRPHIHEILNRANGRWYHCIDKAIRWIDGRMVRFEVAIDIHARKLALDALAESEKKYSALVENAKDGVTIIQDGYRKFSNRAMIDMFGYDHEEIVGQPFVDIVAPSCREPVRKLLHQALERNQMPPLYDSKIIAKDGSVKDVEVSISPIQYEGSPALMGIIRDISERKQMAENLYDSEERYRVLHDYLNVYIPLHLGYSDENYKFKLWNKYSEKMLGFSQEDAIGKMSPADIHETPEEAMEVVRAAEEFGIYDKEVNLRHKDGSLVPVHLVVVPKKNKDGKWIGLYGFAEDITVRKQAETALRESEKRFRDLVENALMGISIYLDGKAVYENPEQKRLVRFAEQATVIRNFGRLVHPNDQDKWQALQAFVYSGNAEGIETDIRFYPEDDAGNKLEMKWVQLRASRIEFGGREAVLINMMDITRAKQLENVLSIEDKMTSLGRVAAGMAHEIRSPLSGINILFSSLSKICAENESIGGEMLREIRTIVTKTMEASHKIESVVRRVIDFTRPGEIRRRLIDVNQPIQEAINLSTVTLRKENIHVKMNLNPEGLCCYADARLIEQVLLNLITNAIQAMNLNIAMKRLEISSGVEGRHAVIRVADSGPGVQTAYWDKIFDPYFSTKSKGSGIGLSLSRRIIKDHSGVLDVSSSKWNGAEFTIRIPMELSAAARAEKAKEAR